MIASTRCAGDRPARLAARNEPTAPMTLALDMVAAQQQQQQHEEQVGVATAPEKVPVSN